MKRLAIEARWFVRYYGVPAMPSTLVGRLLPAVRTSRWYARQKEEAFDRQLGIRTAGPVPVADLDIDDESRRHAVEYSPTPGAGLGLVLEELDLDYSQFTFVDVGCGKGRALFMAAEFPFARILGVELSPALAGTVRDNIAACNWRRLKCHRIDCVEANSTSFDLPATPLVLYFFNPFGAVVLSQVLARVSASLLRVPRPVIVIYCNPVHRELFETSESWSSLRLRTGGAVGGLRGSPAVHVGRGQAGLKPTPPSKDPAAAAARCFT